MGKRRLWRRLHREWCAGFSPEPLEGEDGVYPSGQEKGGDHAEFLPWCFPQSQGTQGNVEHAA